MTVARALGEALMRIHRFLECLAVSVLVAVCCRGSEIAQESRAALPMVAAAAVPLYPPVARITNTQGVFHVRVTTDGHRVIAAHSDETLKPLSDAAEENAKTWEFSTHTPLTFTITYRYKLTQECGVDNPTIVLHLPMEVEVCLRPHIDAECTRCAPSRP